MAVIHRTSKDTGKLNITNNHLDLIDIYRTLHPTSEHTVFLIATGTVTKKDQILGHNKPENIWCMFSDHSGIKLEINKKNEKTMYQNIWEAGKEVFRRKFIVLNVHIGEKKISDQ